MTRENVFAKLERLFQNYFEDGSIKLKENTIVDDIEDWDSLEHISLIASVEKEFEIKFSMKEVNTMKNVGQMVDIIMERM